MTAMRYGLVAKQLAELFDYSLVNDIPPFEPFDISDLANTDFRLGIIVGASGSGKTQTVKSLNLATDAFVWSKGECVADHFADMLTAQRCLHGAGLNSVPQWMKPYHMLSNGEQYRADSAIALARVAVGERCTVLDEFTSVVDRTVARSLCESLDRFLLPNSRFIVATCHDDVLGWLNADWILNMNDRVLSKGQKYKHQWVNHVYETVGVIRRG
jgi:hypothetical protein